MKKLTRIAAAAAVLGFALYGGLAVASYTSTYMGLTIPEVGDPGPTYASNVSDALDLIDAHDHTSGKGTQVPTLGITENADHEFNANDLTEARTIRFDTGAVSIAGTDRRAAYQCGGELCYIDESGNITTITNNGSVTGAAGNITGMTGSASVVYSPTTDTFAFTDDNGFPAGMDHGCIRIAEEVSGGKGPVICSNAATAADFNFTFPSALPAATYVLALEADGDLVPTADAGTLFPVGSVRNVGYSQELTANGTSSAIPVDNSIPQNTEGTEIFTFAYTPKKSGNILIVEGIVPTMGRGNNATDTIAVLALFRDSVADAMAASALHFAAETGESSYMEAGPLHVQISYTAPSTSAITFKLRLGSSAGSAITSDIQAVNFGGGVTPTAIIKVTEIQQ